MSITILNPGMLTSVQDLGRIGYQQFGVSVSGVMDPRSASIANILVGNDEGEAVLECTMMGPHMSAMIIKSREANDLKLTAYHGHFATRHSHNSHYLDITRMKHECAMANIAAASLANYYVYEKEIDTVVCLDGSEVIGTFLARQLSQKNLFSLSSEKNICVVAPEHDSNGLLIFRDNLRPMVSEKNVLLLISTVNSGKTAARALECIEYYGGTTQGVAAVFSALKQVGDIPVISLFSPEDIPGYVTSLVKDCPMCKAGQKIDALSNSYGFSPLT